MPDLQVINITPHTLMTTHEIVRDLANFKMYKKECSPHAPLRSTSTCSVTQEVVQIEFSIFLKGTCIVVTPQAWIWETYIYLNNLILYMLNKIYIHYITTLVVLES